MALFQRESVRTLREADFSLNNSMAPVGLLTTGCTLVYFYGDNAESKNVGQVWSSAASQVAGPLFAACNLSTEAKLAEAFTKISGEADHPLHWVGLRQLPFILVYRGGWPRAFYNGERSTQAIVDYSLTLACLSNYAETQQLSASTQVTTDLETTAARPYTDLRTVSTQYTGASPIRGRDLGLAPVVRGSAEEKAEIARVQAARAAAPVGAGGVAPVGTGGGGAGITTPTAPPPAPSPTGGSIPIAPR